MVFMNPRALGCSVPSEAKALLRAQGFINTIDPVGQGIYSIADSQLLIVTENNPRDRFISF